MRRFDERWQPGNFERNRHAVRQLEALAASNGVTVSQLALAWVLAKGDDIVPIPGTRHQTRLLENLGAASFELDGQDVAQIEAILPSGGFGARYAEKQLPQWI
ncbi:aryl-alcohol dehydrogenase-like predicted oxidoreductase [Luteibacter jiangsuensis]|uniref:Aryl-alcohol dehydrogenase-like predicted oxidoreductase n=1 Tax=Luteibacter jiangsuensis TaxID=637577 RepID=A0ABT9SVT1_9GAMM|nr:aryl-alcohol dehydrogenase-like predicted oxidoreductase [Luteibacter jiangsuensis]